MADRAQLLGALDRSEALALAVAAAVLALAPIGAALLPGTAAFAGAGIFVALILMLTGLHLVAGLAGLPALGQAGFAALGALLAAEATLRLGLPGPVALLLAGGAVGLLGALAAPFLCRLAAPAFAGATLALGALLALPGVQAPDRLALPMPIGAPGYVAATVLALLALLAAWRLTMGEVGAALRIAAENPRMAAASGIDAARLRRHLFALGAALGGLGGGALVQAVGPGAGALDPAASLVLLAAIALGGPRSLLGALLIGVPFCLLAALATHWLGAELLLPLAGLAAAVTLAERRRPHRTATVITAADAGSEAER